MAQHPAAAGGDVNLQDVLRGRTAPRTRSNMIRVFISSTFTDMSSERKALLEKAYPEVLAFCRSLGLVFEVVDLRWGIRNVTSGEHEVCELVLHEIEMCKKISAGPAFVALLGNRYGHRALPRLIPEKHFEVLLSKLHRRPEGVNLLTKWYVRDNNAIPPTYVLQPITAQFPHYNDLRPESGPQHDKALLSWRLTDSTLLQQLRFASSAAEAAGDITAEEKELFFTSVTVQEFQLGLWTGDDELSALLFVRDSLRQRLWDGPKRFAKLMDVTADELSDAEAQGLLTSFKSHLHETYKNILTLNLVELIKGRIDPNYKEHTKYLDNICEQFVSQMKARIGAAVESLGLENRKIWGSIEREDMSDWVEEDVGRHTAISTKMCRGLHGREGLRSKLCLAMCETTTINHGLLVVHGTAGMGKTALLCKLAQELRTEMDDGAMVVIRLLSAHHPKRTDVEHLLRSVCIQICLACGLAPPTSLTAGTHQDLVRFFQKVLAEVSRQGKKLLIILDALDQLSDQHHAHKLGWLPADIPPNVHLVVSMDTNSEVFVRMRLKLKTLENYFEVERLSRDEGQQIMDSYLRASQRTLTPEQREAVLQSFEPTGSPLHLTLILSAAKRWMSSTPLTQLRLGANTQDMMSQLFLMLEEKHGRELVGGALGYIALARDGLLEAELRDVLSLDNDVISEVYRYSLPPTPSLIRLPPLLWARLRRDLEDQLEERWTGGVAAVCFKDRCLWEAVSARYLTSERRGLSLNILAEYFQGRWSGKLKPIALPSLKLILSDRKVPPQPLWFGPGLANVRKLQELPYHLLHAGLWEDLRQEVIGNAQWLFCKSRVCGVSSVIWDLDQCSQYMNCTETQLVRDTLVLIKPSLDFLDGEMDLSLFCAELLARLCSLAKPFPSVIGQLCSWCEEWLLSSTEPVLVPKCSFLQPPGGALQHTLIGLQGGVTCLDVSVEAELLVAGSDDGVMAVWSLADKQLIHTLLGHTAAVLSIKVMDSTAHCFSLAADGSLRKWSLMNGQQLLCIEEAWSVDSAPSSVHLHLFDQLLFVYTSTQYNYPSMQKKYFTDARRETVTFAHIQEEVKYLDVKVWRLDGTQVLLNSSSDERPVVLGVLEDSVLLLMNSGLVGISRPVIGTQTVTIQLTNPARHLTPVNRVTLPKRGKVVMVCRDGFLYQISRSGQHTAVEFPLLPSLLSATEDEKILLAGSDTTLSLFNINGDSMDRFLDLQHHNSVLSACVSSDGRMLVSGAADQLIRIWSVTTGTLLDTFCGLDAPVTRLLLYDGFVLSASTAASCIQLWSLKYDACHKPTAHIPAGSDHVAVFRGADKVFYVQHDGQTEVFSWNNLTGSVSDRFSMPAEVSCLELAQNKHLLLCGMTTGTVLIYPLDQPQETLCIPPPEGLSRVLCLAVSSRENFLAMAYEDFVTLFEITSRAGLPRVEGPVSRFFLPPKALLSSMAMLSDRRLMYGTDCGEVKLYDFTNCSSSSLEPHSSRVTCVTASNLGTHALVGSEDAVQRLWGLNPPGLEHTMEYKGFFFEGVLCAAFSDNDQWVFTGSKDRTVKVWDVATGNLLYVQYVYSPVVRMTTYMNGFMALSQQGYVIREVFHCPDNISPDYNPLMNIKAHYRVTSSEKNQDGQQASMSDYQDFNPAQFNLKVMSMLRDKPSPTCLIL